MKTAIIFLLASCVISLAQMNADNSDSTSDKNAPFDATEQLLNAARSGDTETIKSLLNNGADVNAKDNEGWHPLQLAAKRGDVEIVRFLLENGADVNATNNLGGTALMSAASRGYVEIVKLLLEKGADINAQQTFGSTALMMAAIEGQTNSVELLLDKGADINAKNPNGMTALMFAASAGHTDTVELLLDKGADINAEATNGWDALMFAEVMDMNQTNTSGLNASELLLEKDTGGINAALMYAASAGHTNAVKLLLDKGADINVKDKYGDTLLMQAVSAGHTDVVKLLLDKGAGDINAVLMKAAYQGDTNTVELLLDKGADINAKVIGAFGDTALMNAVVSGDTNVVELLLARRADINTVDTDGSTALGIAKRMGNAAIVQLLRQAGATASSASESFFNAAVASGTNTDSSGYVTNAALLTPFTLTNSVGDVITNAVLVKLTPNKFIYKTPNGGEGMMPLASLSKDLREKFGYDPQAAQAADEVENQKKARQQEIAQQQQDFAAQQAGSKAPNTSQSAASDISSSIRAFAETKWPNDYEMQEYTIKEQTDAYNWLAANGSYAGVPQDVFSQIKSDAIDKWSDDYEMQEYEIKQQADAYVRLHQ